MFTGIIQAVGTVAACTRRGPDLALRIAAGDLPMAEVALGDSIATNGVCLTVTARHATGFEADVSAESLARTTLGGCRVGDRVNLEPALRPLDRLGGHLVSGHVDGVGTLVGKATVGISRRLEIEAPAEIARYIAEQGSICVDGVSLTVNRVTGCRFELNIVPHTLSATTLDEARVGRRVNLEVDLLARYLERLLQAGRAAGSPATGLTLATLAAHGFSGRG